MFAPARTFSVVRDPAGLYLIYTGRAMSLARPEAAGVAGMLAAKPLDRIAAKRLAEIDAVEARLRHDGAPALKDSPYSRFIPNDQLQRIEIIEGAWPIVVIHAGKKVKLHFQHHDLATVRAMFA